MNWLPSMPWCCWLNGRKDIRPVKTQWWGAGVVICLEQGADLHMAQLMPLPLTVSCFSKIQIGFTFLVPAHAGSPGQKGPLNGCVCSTDEIFKISSHNMHCYGHGEIWWLICNRHCKDIFAHGKEIFVKQKHPLYWPKYATSISANTVCQQLPRLD